MNARKCVLTLFKHSRMNQAMSEEEEKKKNRGREKQIVFKLHGLQQIVAIS